MSPDLIREIAQTILDGFNRHFTIFQEITQAAKHRFEQSDWQGEINARKERIDYYDTRVSESIEELNQRFDLDQFDKALWQDVKRWYMWLLYQHQQPELAESFYNSVFCRLFDRSYFNNNHIFVRPGHATDYIDMHAPSYRSYYPDQDGLSSILEQILNSFDLKRNWQDIERDVSLLVENVEELLVTDRVPTPHRQIQVLNTLFFRNHAAYIIGRVLVDVDPRAFVIPILINAEHEMVIDTVVIDQDEITIIFSFTRAYFMADSSVPSGLVNFLSDILPSKTIANIYTAIGFQKQGKTLFYRDFLNHLEHSSDKLIIAPGIKGMVMSVFTLPSYPYVFKVIKDHFDPPKMIDRKTVKQKYRMVKMHDRIGRMADTLEFSHVALPADRFSAELIAELQANISSSLSFSDDQIIIHHLYIERRMTPLNIYLEYGSPEDLEKTIIDYGNAIKEMIAANIFPGDMLLKNFGVTRHGRIVFYDYDEICNMNEINIRRVPLARTVEQEMASEPWYHISDDDFFPEQFEHFVVSHPKVRQIFLKHHTDLLDPAYWKQVQSDIANNIYRDIFPYAQKQRFINRYPELYGV